MFDFCDAPRSNLKRMIFLDIAGADNDPMACLEVVYWIAESENEAEAIAEIAAEVPSR